ncbi:MAG: tetratricopeptide repeat protein [Ignavibacteriaceae bacterium]
MKKRLSIPAFLLALLFTFNLAFAQNGEMKPEAGKLYNAGNELLKAGNYNEAIVNYDNALKIEKDYRTYYQKGIALKKSGKLDEAQAAFESSLSQKKDFEAGYNALGGVYFSKGDYQKAIDNFEKVVEMADDNKTKNAVKKNLSLAYTKLGSAAKSDGNPERAVQHLQKAVENNNYDAAYLLLAQVYTELGQYDKAIAAGESALKYRSGISKGGPYYYMGVAYKNKGDNTKAVQMLNEAKSDATYKKLVEYELTLLK